MQRLLLRLLGRSSSLHQKGCQAINKSIWDSEWERANTKRKQNRTGAQEWERGLRTLSAVSKGSLALDLSESTSYSPTHSHHEQIWVRFSQLHRHVLTITESHREWVTYRSYQECVWPSRSSNFPPEGSLLKYATLNLSPIFIFLIRVHLQCHFKIQ